jgi:hypothetical protein
MHHCLHVTEILRFIFQLTASEESGSRKRNQTLYSIALTCRSFQDPALDLLWYSQTSLVPLFKTLPRDLWDVGTTEDLVDGASRLARIRTRAKTQNLRFVRNPMPNDWIRFNTYASRIRMLEIQELPNHVRLDSTIYKHTKRLPPLLPRLKYFRSMQTGIFFDDGHIFLNPNLQSIQARIFPGQPTVGHATHFFDIALSRCPKITELDVRLEVAALRPKFSSFVRGFMHLEDVSCSLSSLSAESLTHLAGLPTLHKLKLYDSDTSFIALNGNHIRQRFSFPTLRHFVIEGPFMVNLANLFEYFSFQQLQSLHTKTSLDFPISSDFCTLFKNFAKSCSASHLNSIHVEVFVDDDTFIEVEADFLAMDPFTFKPLLNFSELETLIVTYPANLDDETLREIAIAFPRLRNFSIGSGFQVLSTHITLQGLVHLVEHCPSLEHLTITIDVPPDQNPNWSGAVNTVLTTINLERSTIRSFGTTAVLLCNLFVKLERVLSSWTTSDYGDGSYEDNWTSLGDNWEEFALMVAEIARSRKS